MDCTRTSMKAAVPLKPEASISLDLWRRGLIPPQPHHTAFPEFSLHIFTPFPTHALGAISVS